jgi:hypothetical protein
MNRHNENRAKEQIENALSAYRDSVTRIAPSDWQAIEARLNSTVSAPVARRKPVLPSLIPFAVTTAAFAFGAYVAQPHSPSVGPDRTLTWGSNRAEVQNPVMPSIVQSTPEAATEAVQKKIERDVLAVAVRGPRERSRRPLEPVNLATQEEPALQSPTYSEPDASEPAAAYSESSTHYVIGSVPASMSGRDSTTANLSEEQRIW